MQVLAALANGATLLLVAFGIFREAWEQFQHPALVLAGPMLVVAAIGLVGLGGRHRRWRGHPRHRLDAG